MSCFETNEPFRLVLETFVVSKLYLLKIFFVVDLLKKCTCWLRNYKTYTQENYKNLCKVVIK